jgi:PilZ domain
MADNVSNFEYRSPRFRADFRLLVQTGHPHPAILNGRCVDLSEDGLAAEILAPEIRASGLRESLEIGAEVTIIMTLPGNSNTTTFAARVTNQKVGSYGFAFIFSSKAEQAYMHEYLESHHRSIGRSAE